MLVDRTNETARYRMIQRLFNDANRRFFHDTIPPPGFKLNNRMKKAGSVDLCRWQIDISVSYHDKYGWGDELKNTVEHEMIHLYLKTVGKPTGHNRHFKEIMERVGCTLHSKPNRRPHKYVFECPHCRKEYKARKWIGKRFSCGTCSEGSFNKRYVLEFKRRLD